MAAYDNSYSRFIAWAKILLPLFALGVLSTLFLFSHQIDPSKAIPFAKVDVKELAREQRVGAPVYAGVTRDGTAISLKARAALPTPDSPGRMTADQVQATFDMPGGNHINILAGKGTLSGDLGTVRLQGGVEISTSTGYRLRTGALTAGLDRTFLRSDGRVTGDGPLGRLNAGRMELRQGATDKSAYVLVFKDGIKLVYDPKT